MKTLYTLAALLVTSGTALAGDISSRYVYGDAAPAMEAPAVSGIYGYPGELSLAELGQTETSTWNDRFGDAAPRSIVVNPVGVFGFVAETSMTTDRLGQLGESPRIHYGSN